MLSKIGQVLFGHFKMKALALLIALGVWFYANARVTRTIPLDADVEILPPEGYARVYQDRTTAHLRIAGPEFLISRLEEEARQNPPRLRYALAESALEDGYAELAVRPEWLQFELTPQEMVQLRFPAIDPATVTVFASQIVEEMKPVEVAISGSPPRGFRVEEDPITAPRQVRVRGPAVALNAIESISTERVPVWDLRGGDHRKPLQLEAVVNVNLPEGQVVSVPVDLSESRVVARIRIVEETREERTFQDLPLRFMAPPGFPYEYQVQDGSTKFSVTVKAPPSSLTRLDASSVRPYVDLAPLAEEQVAPGETGLYREPVRVDLGTGVDYETIRVTPDRVTLLLKNPGQ